MTSYKIHILGTVAETPENHYYSEDYQPNTGSSMSNPDKL